MLSGIAFPSVAAPAPSRAGESAATALPLVAMQAEQGDPDALLRLGEMYWYGDGAPLDRERGDLMFARAAAAGSAAAHAALTLSAQRRRQSDDITWWLVGYQGDDLNEAASRCVAPVFPQTSASAAEADAVDAAYEAYRVCYNGFVDQLYAASPPVNRIPRQLALLMSETEYGLASDRLNAIYDAAKQRWQQQANGVAAARAGWASQSVAFITTHAMRRRQQVAEAEARSRAFGQFMQDKIRPERPPPANVTGR